ncbi:hypothetical protein C4J81_02260 [Deltaproteobacteria bacterium Smac51]|nr:hypothetical protein C4J81_02260 [Deltaproteobacteria bacterium Smac51]
MYSRACLTLSTFQNKFVISAVFILVSIAMIHSGSLIWIDNSTAFMAKKSSGAMCDYDLFADLPGDLSDQELYQAGHTPEATKGLIIIRGNGNADDNREDADIHNLFITMTSPPKTMKSSGQFKNRRTVVSYIDFGCLKVMPALKETCIVLCGLYQQLKVIP